LYTNFYTLLDRRSVFLVNYRKILSYRCCMAVVSP